MGFLAPLGRHFSSLMPDSCVTADRRHAVYSMLGQNPRAQLPLRIRPHISRKLAIHVLRKQICQVHGLAVTGATEHALTTSGRHANLKHQSRAVQDLFPKDLSQRSCIPLTGRTCARTKDPKSWSLLRTAHNFLKEYKCPCRAARQNPVP